MQQSLNNAAAVQEVDYAVSHLRSLSVLPATAIQYLSKFTQNNFALDPIRQIIESNPALTVNILSSTTDQDCSIADVLSRIEPAELREKLLSTKVLSIFDDKNDGLLLRKELDLHCLTVAVCAKELASLIPTIDPQLAFSAGMLHDIGKLAIDELMPKSFQRLTLEARSQNQSLYSIEQTYLGIDHTILGRHLAQNWTLPPEIITAIWLHHSPAEITLTNIPHTEIALLIHLADLICNFGRPGSFDKSADINKIAERLSLSPEQIHKASDELPHRVAQISQNVALPKTVSATEYCQLLHKVIAQLNNNPITTNGKQKELTEQLVSILTHTKDEQNSLIAAETLIGLAEFAAGAAHELNNPLAVISGRSQLLSNSETDENRKEMLEIISQKAQETTDIVGGLMNFAKPAQPQPKTVSALVLLNNALRLTADKHKIDQLQTQLENIDNLKNAHVDTEQIVTAISNIISNAIESYVNANGPLKIAGAFVPESNLIRLEITDSGCGMSSEVLQKAIQPLYSAKPAGRQRGMGLATASRLIKLNKGSMNITSTPEEGTTVTIFLPCVSESENHS